MYLVAIGWIYIVFMMSITEETIVAAVMTFIFYGLLPVSVIVYIGGSRQRRLRKQMEAEARHKAKNSATETSVAEQENRQIDPPQ
jgi:bacteriorhodopsin